MRGNLSDTSVPEICRQLSDDGVTGALEVTGAAGVARVFLREGSVYWAMSPAPRAQLGSRLVNAGFVSQEQLDHTLEEQQSAPGDRPKLGALLVEKGLVGRDVIRVFVQEQILDALFDLVRWDAGDWAFHAGDAVDERLPIDVPVSQLLVEVSRRQSEWDQIERTLTTLDEVPDHVVGGNATTAALEQDEFTMLASIDGVRSVRELANDLGYSEFEAARIVYGLTLLGIVDVASPGEDEEDEEDEESVVDEILDLGTARGDTAQAEPPDDEIDVGEALEAALFGEDEPEAAEPELVQEPAEPVQEPAEPAADDDALQVTVHFSLDDGVEDRSAHAQPGPSEAVPTAGAAPTDDAEGPEPWVFSADDFEEAAGLADEAARPRDGDPGHDPEPAPRPSAVDDEEPSTAELSDDLEALVAELDVGDDESPSAPTEPAGVEPTEEPAPGPGTAASDLDDYAPQRAATPEDAGDRDARADVSEFLRELTRLNLDDEARGDEPADDEAPAEPAEPPKRRSTAKDEDDKDKKKKGLFGWGR